MLLCGYFLYGYYGSNDTFTPLLFHISIIPPNILLFYVNILYLLLSFK